jgi:imidazolonepropionase-like amidohydrolase
MRSCKVAVAIATAALLLPLALRAEPPSVHALTDVRIVVAPGQTIERGTVVVRNGVIEAVGESVSPPPEARLWDGEGLTVYAGLIESYSVAAWPESVEKEDPPQAGHENSLVRPERDMALFAADDSAHTKLRAAGFTTAVVAPRQGLFRGQSALVNLGEGAPAENLLRRGVAQNVTFRTNPDGGYPDSLMGSIALFRQTVLDARWHAEAQARYERNPAQTRPPVNTALEALGSTVDGDLMVVETGSAAGSLRAAHHIRELGLEAYLVGNGHEYKWAEEIAASGLPHLLPLKFPEAPKVGDEDDLSISLAELRHWDSAPGNPRAVLDAGLEVAFTTYELGDPKKIHDMLARAIENGLTADEALAGLTVTPAKLFGISDRAGTVEAGKMANLVVVEGDLFGESPKIRSVWVDGDRFEIGESKPAEVDPVGTWELEVDAGDGQILPVQMIIEGELGSLVGEVSVMGGTLSLTSAEVSGSTLTVTFDGASLGMPGEFTIDLDLEGDSASGSGTGPTGGFALEGRRVSQPDNPEVTR